MTRFTRKTEWLFRRKRRSLALLLVSVTAVLGIAVAAGAATGVSGNVEVVSFYPEGSADYGNLQAIDKGFEAEYPNAHTTLTFGGGESAPNIVARFRAGNPPEVNVGFFGAGPTASAYATSGQLVDLTSAMNQPLPANYGYGANTKWSDALLPAVKPFLQLKGHYYAAPSEITAITFFYNRAIFKKYNLQPPKTWADFLAVCKKLKSSGVAPLTVTGTFNGYMQLYFDYLLARRAGTKAPFNAINDPSKSFASVPGVQAAASDLQGLVKNGYFLNGFQATDFTAAQLDFFQGKAAMILMGTWLEGEMKGSIPPGFALGTFPFPSIPGGKGNGVVFGAVNARTVAAKSANPAGGVAWLRYEARKKVQAARIKYLQYISPYKGVATDPKYQLLQQSFSAPDGRFVPSYFGVFGQSAAVRDAYQVPIAKLFFGQETAAQMVADIDNGLHTAARS